MALEPKQIQNFIPPHHRLSGLSRKRQRREHLSSAFYSSGKSAHADVMLTEAWRSAIGLGLPLPRLTSSILHTKIGSTKIRSGRKDDGSFEKQFSEAVKNAKKGKYTAAPYAHFHVVTQRW